MTFDLTGKNIVIIGGAGLIGSEMSRECARQGANVVVAELDTKRAEAIVKDIKKNGGKAIAETCDTTNETSVRALVKRVVKRYKRVDALVNTAHFPRREDVTVYFNDHIGGPLLAAREFAKPMMKQKSGVIIFLGSIYGVHAPRLQIYEGTTTMVVPPEYEAAKAGLIQLTKYLAKLWGPKGIRVNAVSPGGVFDKQDEKFVKAYSSHVVLGKRMANPDDIAPTLVYLLSDASKYITGQNIIIDGGWTL